MPWFNWFSGGLRRHLVVLILVPLVPMLLWAGGLILWSSLQERRSLARGMDEAAQALAVAVDQEIGRTTAVLDTAALSRALARRDAADFVPVARRLLSMHSEWAALGVFDAGGRAVFSTSAALDADPRSRAGIQAAIGRVLSGAAVAVTGALPAGPSVLVAVPAFDMAGRAAYVLTASIPAERLADLLRSQQFQLGWRAAITDAEGGVIVRAQDDLDGAIPAGWLRAEIRAPLTGWTVTIAAPDGGATANLRGSLGVTLGFGLVVLGCSIFLARALARRILRPVQALTAIARPFLGDRPPSSRLFGITELDALHQALDVLSGELETTQEHFLSFFSAAPVMLFVLDESDRLIAVNDAWTHTLGYGRDEVLGHAPWAFHPGAAPLDGWGEFRRRGSLDRQPAQYLCKTGEVRDVLVSLRADRDAHGRIVRTIGAILDVTEQRRAEAGLARAVEDAERANDAKTRFLAAASHDLRQPLQALSLYLGVLKARLQGREEQVMEAVGQCVESLTGLLNDMLDVARLDAGVITPKLADVPASRLLERVSAAWRIQAEAKGLKLSVMPSAAMVRTDPVLMDRVLSNLVANAVRYTERGRILVGCRRPAPGQVRIEVLDSGIGIPADKLGEIFEEFRQLGNPERRRDKGTGLGLSIVRRIVDLLGHRLSVRSVAGRGSAFTITLPAALTGAEVAEDALAPADHARRILVVDDESLVRNALELVLEEMGHQVDSAETVEEALRQSREHHPQLVIADFRLAGGTTGIDVIRAVRATCGRDLPAVVLTGDTDPATIRRIVGEGLHLLHKPLRLEALRGFLKQVA